MIVFCCTTRFWFLVRRLLGFGPVVLLRLFVDGLLSRQTAFAFQLLPHAFLLFLEGTLLFGQQLAFCFKSLTLLLLFPLFFIFAFLLQPGFLIQPTLLFLGLTSQFRLLRLQLFASTLFGFQFSLESLAKRCGFLSLIRLLCRRRRSLGFLLFLLSQFFLLRLGQPRRVGSSVILITIIFVFTILVVFVVIITLIIIILLLLIFILGGWFGSIGIVVRPVCFLLLFLETGFFRRLLGLFLFLLDAFFFLLCQNASRLGDYTWALDRLIIVVVFLLTVVHWLWFLFGRRFCRWCGWFLDGRCRRCCRHIACLVCRGFAVDFCCQCLNFILPVIVVIPGLVLVLLPHLTAAGLRSPATSDRCIITVAHKQHSPLAR
eukprot:m.121921 g.121921  ORF g.121921 m.121921 type:complete len:374 (+) comp11094_c0_seq1:2402-3523(+)